MAVLPLVMAPFHLRTPAIPTPWTWYLEYRVVYAVEGIRTFHDGRRGEGKIHDSQPNPVQHLILESKAAIWAILVAAAFVVVDGLNPMHLSVSIRPGKIIVGEL